MTRKKPARTRKTFKNIDQFKEHYFPKTTYEELLRRVTSLENEVAMLRAACLILPYIKEQDDKR